MSIQNSSPVHDTREMEQLTKFRDCACFLVCLLWPRCTGSKLKLPNLSPVIIYPPLLRLQADVNSVLRNPQHLDLISPQGRRLCCPLSLQEALVGAAVADTALPHGGITGPGCGAQK